MSAATKALVQVATKQLSSKGGVRLGGREERREVYRRFQDALVDSSSFADVLRLERTFSGPFMAARHRRDLMAQMHQHRTELLKAYADLRLVANPGPLAAANTALNALTESFDAGAGIKEDALQKIRARIGEAQREFTDVCRDDLWYLPQRWQVHRRIPLWWKARRAAA
jgi:hypothetical protein